jgi:hypothetical protein
MLPNTNKVEIELKYGELEPILDWCKRNCLCEWCYEQLTPAGQIHGEYEFYFEHEKDLIAFTIWKT